MDYRAFFSKIAEQNRLPMDTLRLRQHKGIPTGRIHIMQHEYIERIAGVPSVEYRRNPEDVYVSCLRNLGSNIFYQWIPLNPLTMGNRGYEEGRDRGATTGAERIICNGMLIDSPEATVEHMERFEFPKFRDAIADFNEDRRVEEILHREQEIQQKIGPGILNVCGGGSYVHFPQLYYGHYGYENYFMTYALYPEIIEKHFSLQADLALLHNRALARAYKEGDLPPASWVAHDMADSRGTIVDVKSLDKIWFPHFARCIEPMLGTDVRLVWHCDGNLMQMVPRLLDAGIKGFQGFQYEDGMDYEKICSMKTRDGEGLLIWAGISVTRTLPFGTSADVKKEIKWLVEKGPRVGLFLGGSSALAPGIPWENIQTMLEGFKYYREHGREKTIQAGDTKPC
ncbi:MAG: hypothetical protein A3F84_01925 [Candidatus Handelsmanbacteria bacterium RIFCSPLOWO2_12_FULL_64_10]|uniref:Uroporphyrinogen decarboxylase (URO-D) domain-containing protein n=1 Tax=Handelsmanbacteria sp. (strain RIFCSPLOWO2_12_FULL_64_10) TaxID=1817868 RepID=A0A1F6CA76_HANXR|nr:MAG: hypothetical protein A3F84_01925 [Candidatus Handelsmanbacteria bacterium RIFCSPLOWO2_12_FULL_64_10]